VSLPDSIASASAAQQAGETPAVPGSFVQYNFSAHGSTSSPMGAGSAGGPGNCLVATPIKSEFLSSMNGGAAAAGAPRKRKVLHSCGRRLQPGLQAYPYG